MTSFEQFEHLRERLLRDLNTLNSHPDQRVIASFFKREIERDLNVKTTAALAGHLDTIADFKSNVRHCFDNVPPATMLRLCDTYSEILEIARGAWVHA